MIFQTSFFWAINCYDQAKVGKALLHTQGTHSQHRVCWCFLGLNRQTKVKATSPIPSNIPTDVHQDKDLQGIHIHHQRARMNICCLNYGSRLILEKLIVTASLRFFFFSYLNNRVGSLDFPLFFLGSKREASTSPVLKPSRHTRS